MEGFKKPDVSPCTDQLRDCDSDKGEGGPKFHNILRTSCANGPSVEAVPEGARRAARPPSGGGGGDTGHRDDGREVPHDYPGTRINDFKNGYKINIFLMWSNQIIQSQRTFSV